MIIIYAKGAQAITQFLVTERREKRASTDNRAWGNKLSAADYIGFNIKSLQAYRYLFLIG